MYEYPVPQGSDQHSIYIINKQTDKQTKTRFRFNPLGAFQPKVFEYLQTQGGLLQLCSMCKTNSTLEFTDIRWQ